MFLCVCCMLSRTHAFLYMWCEFRCPIGPWTLTQCPACELAISLQALTAGGRAYRCLPGQTAAPFPHPALRQWSLVRHPPLLNVSTHVTTSLSHHKLCVFFSLHPNVWPLALSPRGSACLSVARLHPSFVYVSHRLYFLQECWQVINATAAEWQLCCIVNILPHSHIYRHKSQFITLWYTLKYPSQKATKGFKL